MSKKVQEVFPVLPADYEELSGFLRDFPGFQQRTQKFWFRRLRFWWDLNPAFSEKFSRGWLFRDQGRIVGFFGATPLKLQLSGKETTVFAGSTWRVLPEYRGMSMALKSRQMEEHKEVLHMSVKTRQEIVPLLKLLRYQAVHRSEKQQSLLVTDFAKVMRGKFQQKPGGALIAGMLSPIGYAGQALRTLRMTQLANKNVKEVTKADGAFDALWQRTKNRYANTNVRTAEVINWYCFSIEELRKTLLGYYEGDKLLGYMMFFPDESPTMKALDCVDLWIDPSGPQQTVLASLVAKAGACARAKGFDRVVFPHFNSEIASLYESLGLMQRPAWKLNEFFKGPAHLTENILPENTYFVGAQGDVGL